MLQDAGSHLRCAKNEGESVTIPPDNKVVRSLCWFAESPQAFHVQEEISRAEALLKERGYTVQTRRICFNDSRIRSLASWNNGEDLYLSVGSLKPKAAREEIDDFLHAGNVSFNLDLSAGVDLADVDVLFRIIREKPEKTFQFCYAFRNRPSSPFFPSASYDSPGFAVGLQATNLSEGCNTLEEWLALMKVVWVEICTIFERQPFFLGIDSSVAPLFRGKSSLVHFVKRLYGAFSRAATTDLYVRLTRFLSSENPNPVGLCGLMLPCLEDFELAEEYEAGEFSTERNLFLALHSGLGLDTYPIGIDEEPGRILQVLCLLQAMAAKYDKPLSARFVSDGKARIGDRTDFRNKYLKDVRLRPL
jgi:hypothetical protein